MNFPETRPTLIHRLAHSGSEADWQQFVADYWGPVCRFAARRGNLSAEDAEDVASQTFMALVGNQLLVRWAAQHSAKLRTLLCSVVRNIISNRARVEIGRANLVGVRVEGNDGNLLESLDAPADQVDAFYAAWADDLLEQAIETLLDEYHRTGKGDYFRVLYSRLCEQMAMNDVAEALQMPLATADNHFRAARKRLAAILEELVRQHVQRYVDETQAGEEFTQEWTRLGDYLKQHGGLDEALRAATPCCDGSDSAGGLRDAAGGLRGRSQHRTQQIKLTVSRLGTKPPV